MDPIALISVFAVVVLVGLIMGTTRLADTVFTAATHRTDTPYADFKAMDARGERAVAALFMSVALMLLAGLAALT